MKNRILVMLAGCLMLLLHGAAAYGLMQVKGNNRSQPPVHIVQATLLPAVEAVAVRATEPKPAEVRAARKQKPEVKPPKPKKSAEKKRRKKVRRKVARKQPPPPEPQAVLMQSPEVVVMPQLMTSTAQHVSAEAVYVPPQPIEPVEVVAPQAVEAGDIDTDADGGKAADTPVAAPAGGTQGSGAGQIVTGSISQADYLNNPKPRYPSASRRLGEQGTVRLEVLVSARGTAQRVRILKSSGHPRLDRAARSTVKSAWRFTPKRINGQAVAQRVRFNMPFILN